MSSSCVTVRLVLDEDPLRQRLVDSALELLAQDGLDAVSLRAIARRAGVSHGAPRWHFPTRAALLCAVAHRGFIELGERMGPVLVDRGSPPLARLAAACRVYVAFAQDRTSLFELMFRHDLLEESEPWLRFTSLPLFAALVELVGEAQAGGWRTARAPDAVAGALWGSVHGLAQLWLWGSLPLAMPDRALEDVLDVALAVWFVDARDPG